MNFKKSVATFTGISLIGKIFSLSRGNNNYLDNVVSEIKDKKEEKLKNPEITKDQAKFNFKFSISMIYLSYAALIFGAYSFISNTSFTEGTSIAEIIVRLTSVLAIFIFSLALAYRFAVINFFSRCFYLEVKDKESLFKSYSKEHLLDILFPTELSLKI